jgi:nitrate reductase gamma subunit
MEGMGKVMIAAAYFVYAAFWIRFLLHALVWWRAVNRLTPEPRLLPAWAPKACAFTVLDVLFLGRVFMVNPLLWLGEWVFHVSFLLVLFRHLRYFLNPVPGWVWAMQTPGLIAAYILPFSLAYIFIVRLLTKREKYASPANMVLLLLVFAISSIGLLMNLAFKPNLIDAKLFILGILSFAPATPPDSLLFALHFVLVLALVLLLPSHIFTAPLVMYEARKRGLVLHAVMHDEENDTGGEPRQYGKRWP